MSNTLVRRSFFDDFFNDVAPGFFIKPLHGNPLPRAGQIRVDVKEDKDAYKVEAEVPGVAKEDIQVSVDGSVVTLSAEIRQHDSAKDGEKVLRTERYYGSVSRSFQLPLDIDQATARARYENGVLLLTLPKKQAGASQTLTIE